MPNLGPLGPLMAMDAGAGMLLVSGAPLLLVLSYIFILWDQRREGSENKDDPQVGLKLVLYFLLVVGLGIAADGTRTLLHYLLSGTKAGSGSLKAGIAGLVSGGAIVFGMFYLFLPRTNFKQYPKSMRYAVGYVAAGAGLAAALALSFFVSSLIMGASWASTTSNWMASMLVFGGLGFVALNRFGTMSGWTAPVKPAPMQAPGAYPQQPGAYPGQPQPGYPGQQQQPMPGQQQPMPGQQQPGAPMPGQQQPGQGQGQQGGGPAGLPPPHGGGYPGGGFPPGGGGFPPQGQ